MNATIVALRVDGHGTEHLSLHVSRHLAQRRLAEVGAELWRDRFGYELPDRGVLDASDRLGAEGWRVRVEELEVEL